MPYIVTKRYEIKDDLYEFVYSATAIEDLPISYPKLGEVAYALTLVPRDIAIEELPHKLFQLHAVDTLWIVKVTRDNTTYAYHIDTVEDTQMAEKLYDHFMDVFAKEIKASRAK